MTRKQEDFYKLVGIRNGGELVMVDYLFEESKTFKGATGTVFEVMSKEKAEEINEQIKNNEYADYDDWWREAVYNKHTELGLYEWLEEIVNESKLNGYDFEGQDQSYINELTDAIESLSPENLEKLHEFYEEQGETYKDYVFNCVGGGRCFDADQEWDVVFDQELLNKINDIERK